jgi:DNA-nicking Smr family endonuclease
MAKKSDSDDTDITLFRTAMRDVKVISTPKKIDRTAAKPNRTPPKKSKASADPPVDALSDYETLDDLTAEDKVSFNKPGIQHKTLRKMRAGQYNTEAILDMHGMTVVDARQSLLSFLAQCEQKSLCHLLIIHGKGRTSGKPILKNRLNHWLRQIEPVLAFCSAAAKDGRSGAMYVLLKNKKGRNKFDT